MEKSGVKIEFFAVLVTVASCFLEAVECGDIHKETIKTTYFCLIRGQDVEQSSGSGSDSIVRCPRPMFQRHPYWNVKSGCWPHPRFPDSGGQSRRRNQEKEFRGNSRKRVIDGAKYGKQELLENYHSKWPRETSHQCTNSAQSLPFPSHPSGMPHCHCINQPTQGH